MPRFVLRIEAYDTEWFLPWSTIVDAPIAYAMTESEYRDWFEVQYGRRALMDLDAHIARAKETGCSQHGQTLEDALTCNRAGPDETEASLAELIAAFVQHPDPNTGD